MRKPFVWSIIVVCCTLTLTLIYITSAPVFAAQITATPGAIQLQPVEPIIESIVPSQQPTEQPPVNATTIALNPDWIGPENYAENINPLTGLTVEDPSVLNHRPIVTKISNAPPLVRPQAGIGQADLVFEHYAEGGLTRFSAIFYSTLPERVGSIRSGRLVDYELVPMYQALLAFSGGSTGVEEKIYGSEALNIVEARQAEGKPVLAPSDFAIRAYKGVFYGLPYYFRDEGIAVPHNLFTNLRALSQLATNDNVNQRPDLRGMVFSPEPPSGETGPANLVDVRYRATRVQWNYNPENSQYMRTSDGQPHVDANTGEQVAASNVVIIYANHQFTDIVESEWQGSKSYSIEIQLWFEGNALVARDGRWYDARWVRPTRESMITLQTMDGQPFPLKPGKTWFQLVRLPEQMEAESEWVRVE